LEIDLTVASGYKTIPLDNRHFFDYTKHGSFYSKACWGATKYISGFMRFYTTSGFRIKSAHFRIKSSSGQRFKC
jgi:hypothetical protein